MPKDYLETVQAEEAAFHMRLIRPLKNKPFIFNHGYKEDGKFHHSYAASFQVCIIVALLTALFFIGIILNISKASYQKDFEMKKKS